MTTTLSPQERIAVSGAAVLAMQWQFKTDRMALLALLREAMPCLRPDPDFNGLRSSIAAMLAASTQVEWNDATARAAHAVAPLLRRDITAALRHLPQEG